MIRINLLPFRLERKKENIRRQVSVFFLSIALILVLLAWYTMGMNQDIIKTRQKTDRVKAQIVLYKEKADKVTRIKENLKILEDKLKIVESLKLRRNEQILLLEVLAGKVVPERMWVESLKVDAAGITIKGIAFDNPTIADFMKNLETSSFFSEIDLKRSKIQKFKDDVMLKSFELLCKKKEPNLTDKEKQDKKGK